MLSSVFRSFRDTHFQIIVLSDRLKAGRVLKGTSVIEERMPKRKRTGRSGDGNNNPHQGLEPVSITDKNWIKPDVNMMK